MDLLEQYQQEIREDLDINEMNIKISSMQLPAKKHYWVSKLITTKQQHQRLLRQKKQAKDKIAQELIHKSPIKLSSTDLAKALEAAEKTGNLAQLNAQIDDTTLIIEYLEKVEKILHNMTWDVKNIIQLHFSEKQ